MLRALGRSDRLAQSSLRLSLGRFTTGERRRLRRPARSVTRSTRLRASAPPGADAARALSDDPRYGAEVRRRMRDAGRARATLPAGPASSARVARATGSRAPRSSFELRIEGGPGRGGALPGLRLSALRRRRLVAHRAAARGWTRAELAAWDWREAAEALEVPPAKFGRLLTLQDAVRDAARNWPGAAASTV